MIRNAALIAVLMLAAVAPPVASQPLDPGTPTSMGAINFATEVLVAPSGDGGGSIEVTYTLAHRALNFLRHNGGYRARYEVTAIVYDEDGRQVTGDSWRRTVQVATYDETNSRKKADTDTIRFSVEPGDYTLKLEVESLDTGAVGRTERRLTVPSMEEGSLTIGTIRYSRLVKEGAEHRVEPNPSRAYGEDNPVALATVPVYGVPGTRFAIDVSIVNNRGTRKKGTSDTLDQDGFLTEFLYEFSVLDLEVGSYVVRADVRPLPDGEETSLRSRFRVITSPVGWGEDQEKMLAQIGYVAERDEVEALREAPPELRDAAWERFWARHDPYPETEENEFRTEFLRRLAYANATFSSVIEGWQTDMGRVYIQHGEPDEIESEPVGQMLNSWEIWYYYEDHTKYVFIDREGFGEFELYETSRI